MISTLVKGIHELHGTNLSEYRIYGAKLQDENSIGFMDIMVYDVTTSYIASYFISIFVILRIRSLLGVAGAKISYKTAVLHKQFFRAQIAQAAMPPVFLIPFVFILTYASLNNINLANLTLVVSYWLWLSPSATVSI
ncbi:hypothetical protein PMAYCL1PPCAC_04031, partial [Pristionchus mayeri]